MPRSEEYVKYLESQHWHDLREDALNRSNRKCEACFEKAVQGHHLIYRAPLESCTVEDIMALCAHCHDKWHDWLKENHYRVDQFCRQSTRGGILVLLSRKARSNPKVGKCKKAKKKPAKEPKLDNKLRALEIVSTKDFRDLIQRAPSRHQFKTALRDFTKGYDHHLRSRISATAFASFYKIHGRC